MIRRTLEIMEKAFSQIKGISFLIVRCLNVPHDPTLSLGGPAIDLLKCACRHRFFWVYFCFEIYPFFQKNGYIANGYISNIFKKWVYFPNMYAQKSPLLKNNAFRF